jgi:hypothetical protein
MNGSTQDQPELKPAGSIPLKRPIRLWPAVLILLLASGAVVWIRFFREISFQERNLQTTFAVVTTFLLLLFWCLFFSRLRWLCDQRLHSAHIRLDEVRQHLGRRVL